MVNSQAHAGLAVFRADASPALGSGHVMRCLALADALITRGWRIGFACSPETLTTVPQLGMATLDILVIDASVEQEPVQLARHWAHADWLVVDHYRRDADFETACRPWASHIFVIDDLANRAHNADCLLDMTLGRDAADYAQLVSGTCQFLLGTDYALTRPQFVQARADSLSRRLNKTAVQRLLISLGATDPVNATGFVLEALAESDGAFEIDVVLSSAAACLDQVREQAARLSQVTRLQIDVADMSGLMQQADLSIGACGTTAWERCILGLPTVAIVTGDDQRRIAAALQQAGAAHVCGWHADLDQAALRAAIEQLCTHPEELNEMSVRAAMVCDGRGAQRVAEYLAS
ncbi:MAG: UDP-2,4-diacetamido-2,4,6-trideoxy-beta-L-altropyranose hydrolase [Gammaproteobacteria bacterium]|nr:UDP-2,4-diacetamido-2,4,6-trideoxy-beta-L-altropyranose hydrolase [Gammaproteobacteria bacterium]MBU2479102.1 UDP-2,4-diacetamido-2,4,6-trideoxy-beta-L-altropyranose hydrolase [Gammaproteobacteria bacterium]